MCSFLNKEKKKLAAIPEDKIKPRPAVFKYNPRRRAAVGYELLSGYRYRRGRGVGGRRRAGRRGREGEEGPAVPVRPALPASSLQASSSPDA